MIKKYIFFILSLILGVFIYLNSYFLIKNIKYYDWHYFDGLISRNFINQEPKLSDILNLSQKTNYDYSWLSREELIFISHRGGKYYQTGENTKTTITDSLKKSSQFIEVDLILDGERIVCLSNEVFYDDLCDLDWIINLLIENDFFLVIDFKSDVHDIDLYKEFYEKLGESKNFSIIKNRIIPQVYNFQHLMILDQLDFSIGPIFTTYKTNIPLDLIFKYLPRFGVKVVAIPISEINIIKDFQDGDFVYFTYPVVTYKEFSLIEKLNIKGIYTPTFEELKTKNKIMRNGK